MPRISPEEAVMVANIVRFVWGKTDFLERVNDSLEMMDGTDAKAQIKEVVKKLEDTKSNW